MIARPSPTPAAPPVDAQRLDPSAPAAQLHAALAAAAAEATAALLRAEGERRARARAPRG